MIPHRELWWWSALVGALFSVASNLGQRSGPELYVGVGVSLGWFALVGLGARIGRGGRVLVATVLAASTVALELAVRADGGRLTGSLVVAPAVAFYCAWEWARSRAQAA